MLILSQNSIQTICLRLGHDDIDDLTFKTVVTLEINHLMTSRVTCQIAFRPRALPFRQHAKRSSDVRLVNLLLRRTMHFLEFEETRLLFSLRNVIFKLRGWSAGAFRILEDVKTVVVTLLHESYG